METVTAAAGGDTQAQTKAILAQMNAFMADVRGFKEEMTAQQGEVVCLALKRSRQDQPHSLRRLGNAAQMAFVEEVAEYIKEARPD